MRPSILLAAILIVACGGPSNTGPTPAHVETHGVEGETDEEIAGTEEEVSGAPSCAEQCETARISCESEIAAEIAACESQCASDYPDESGRQSCNAECGLQFDMTGSSCDEEAQTCLQTCSGV